MRVAIAFTVRQQLDSGGPWIANACGITWDDLAMYGSLPDLLAAHKARKQVVTALLAMPNVDVFLKRCFQMILVSHVLLTGQGIGTIE